MEESSQIFESDNAPGEPPDFLEVIVKEDPDQLEVERHTADYRLEDDDVRVARNNAEEKSAAIRKKVRLDPRTGLMETTLVRPRRKHQRRLKKPLPAAPRIPSEAPKQRNVFGGALVTWVTGGSRSEDPVFCWMGNDRRRKKIQTQNSHIPAERSQVKIPCGMSATFDPESSSQTEEEVERGVNRSIESAPSDAEKEVTVVDPLGVLDPQIDVIQAATRALGYRPHKRMMVKRSAGVRAATRLPPAFAKPPSQAPRKRPCTEQFQCQVELEDCRKVLSMERTDLLQERCRLQVAQIKLERDRRQLEQREQKLKRAESQPSPRPAASLPLTADALRQVSSGAKALAEELARDRHALEEQRRTLAAQQQVVCAQQEAVAAARAALASEQEALKAQGDVISKEWELLRDGEAALTRERTALAWEHKAFDAGRAALREGTEVLEMERKAVRLQQAAQEEERRALNAERQSLEKRRLALMALELGQQAGANAPWNSEAALSGARCPYL